MKPHERILDDLRAVQARRQELFGRPEPWQPWVPKPEAPSEQLKAERAADGVTVTE